MRRLVSFADISLGNTRHQNALSTLFMNIDGLDTTHFEAARVRSYLPATTLKAKAKPPEQLSAPAPAAAKIESQASAPVQQRVRSQFPTISALEQLCAIGQGVTKPASTSAPQA